VQHHHAHIAAVLAEHRVEEPVLGLALDGVGLGTDGGIWGGELLHVDGMHCRRLGHLQALPMPGGDRAAREPWRMAAAALHLLGRTAEIPARFPDQRGAATVQQMLERSINTPATSSMGRAFDAAAGLLKIHAINNFEGQAAMLLEGWAEIHGETLPLQDGYRIDADNLLDLRPLYEALADCQDSAHGAALFHATLAAALADWAEQAARRAGLRTVACGGGCFLNHLLALKLTALLRQRGLRVLLAQQLPPNDGGLSLGQAWVARLTLMAGKATH
jgi:hydrogenase maturation protein HypF